MAVISLLTVQNTRSVEEVSLVEPDLIERQIRAVLADIAPRAVKTGALGSARAIETVARVLGEVSCPVVVDPVMVSKHGARLIDPDACEVLARQLLPCADLVTPNLEEAAILSAVSRKGAGTLREIAEAICLLGAKAVLIKGGHGKGDPSDYLLTGEGETTFPGLRIETAHTHGTGCTLSAVITAELAKGRGLAEAVQTAKAFIQEAIQKHPGLGQGCGPVNHFVNPSGR